MSRRGCRHEMDQQALRLPSWMPPQRAQHHQVEAVGGNRLGHAGSNAATAMAAAANFADIISAPPTGLNEPEVSLPARRRLPEITSAAGSAVGDAARQIAKSMQVSVEQEMARTLLTRIVGNGLPAPRRMIDLARRPLRSWLPSARNGSARRSTPCRLMLLCCAALRTFALQHDYADGDCQMFALQAQAVP